MLHVVVTNRQKSLKIARKQKNFEKLAKTTKNFRDFVGGGIDLILFDESFGFTTKTFCIGHKWFGFVDYIAEVRS